MKTTRKIGYVDSIRIVHKDKDGKVISDRIINNGFWHRVLVKLHLRHNSVLNNGMALAAALLGNVASAPAAVQYVGIGSGTTAASSTDVWLQTPVTVQSATSITRVSTVVTNDTLQLVFTFGSTAAQGTITTTGNFAISEVIASNGSGTTSYSASGTNIGFLHQVYSPVDNCNFANGDSLQVTIKVKCEQGS